MAKMPMSKVVKMPAPMRMAKPKAELDAIPLTRSPIRANKGMDIISVTTRMRETPKKKGKY